MTRTTRFLIITAVVTLAAAGGLYLLSRHVRSALVDRPFVAIIRQELRSLIAGQQAYHTANGAYTTEVIRVWRARGDSTARGIRLRIIAADRRGFIAEGRSDYWTGRCVVAVGPFTGDSLTQSEPSCHTH